jgi:formate hydrogenlyase subunit 5
MTTEPAHSVLPGRPDWLPRDLHGTVEPGPDGEIWVTVAPGGFTTAARVLHGAGARFVTLLLETRPRRSLVGVFALRAHLIALRAPAPEGQPSHHGSLGPWWPAARWAERELAERAGIVPLDLTLGDERLTAPDPDRVDPQVRGADVFAIPYGPIRSGVFESIQFLIETGGEDVPRLETRPFFKHRGMEGRFRGVEPARAVHVAERVAGVASVAHATAFSQAVERALGVEPPARALRWRMVLGELERMANHLDVIAKEAETTALFVGQARFQILKEDVLRLQAQLSGSRFGRGTIVPGGVRGEGHLQPSRLLEALDRLEEDLRRDRRLFLSTGSMTDRLVGSGVLPRSLVEEYGGVGPVARGSGLSTDARHERPYGDFERLGLEVVTERDGDAMARVEVRFGELAESLRLLRGTVDHLRSGNGDLCAEMPEAGRGSAFGWVEAPQGELVVWVEIADGIVQNVHVASPSLRNWALFSQAFPSDVLTDFAFIEHSFGLTPAGADR